MTYRASSTPEIQDLAALTEFVRREFKRIEEDSLVQDFLYLKKSYAAPAKPRDGMVVLADGTSWNPGAGAGYYGYNGGTWTKF